MRTLAFGELDASFWGVAWSPAPGAAGFVGLGDGSSGALSGAELQGVGERGDWHLDGDGLQLTASPAEGDTAVIEATGFDQLCRVRGRAVLGGIEREIDCIGRRGAHGEGVNLDRYEAVRDLCAWFEPGDGLALVALRPRKSRGQDADLIDAAVFDPERTLVIAQPRLSTTYTGDGRPLRAGLELWLGDEDEEQYPRRATGEAAGDGAAGALEGYDVRARPFRWRSRGRVGVGIYLLARRR
jgi:hypothetical protein